MITNTRETNGPTSNTTPNTTTNTNDRKEAAGQGGTQMTQHDRERPVESARETGRRGGTGMQRQRGASPALGGTADPFTLMRRMAEDMDRLFDQFGFPGTSTALTPRLGSWLGEDPWVTGDADSLPTLWSPRVETFRRGDELVVRADIPGVKKDDVHVEIENDVLTIRGERRDEREEERDDYYRSERSYGRFYRAIPLPEGVSTEQCDASFENGVLEVTLPAPKQEERKAKRIQVK
jgi:HSP20 family protein